MSPTESPQLAPGTRLNGVFEIDGFLGCGRRGETYRAHAVETRGPVAIRTMRAGSPLALALFRREAAVLHEVHHDAIVRYYLFSHDPGIDRHYLAMEFVDGPPLSALMEEGPLAFGAVHVLRERLAAGLNAAHQRGIFHGGISPGRVLIPGRDLARAKIIGFGAARPEGDVAVGGGGADLDFDYAAPEQFGLFGGHVTGRTDIYSLGLVLAACLLGRPLDMGRMPLDIVEKRRAVPDLAEIDLRVRPLLEKMLQPDPAARLQSMAAVAAWRPRADAAPALRDAARSSASRTPPRSAGAKPAPAGLLASALAPQWRAARIAAAAAILAVLVAAGYYAASDWFAAPSDPDMIPNREDVRPRIAPPDGPASGSRQRIIDFVAAYNGGDCFFIAPEDISDGRATLDGLGSSVAPFEIFDYEFKRRNGFEPSVGVHQVMAEQCPAVSFLFHTRHHRSTAPRLEAVTTGLKDGNPLTGFVDDPGAGVVELLLVADDGYVRNLSPLLRQSGAARTFSVGIRKTSPGPARPLILMAVASARPLEALRLPPDGTLAAQVFPKALAEAARGGQPLSVTVKYFMLEK